MALLYTKMREEMSTTREGSDERIRKLENAIGFLGKVRRVL